MDEPRTPRDIASAASRGRIMDVAERFMAEKGYAATSIAVICQDSGLPSGSVYHHFGSKVGLLRAVCERGSRRFFEELPGPGSFGGPPEERIVAHYRAAAEAVLHNVSFFRIEAALLLHPNDDPEIRDVVAETRAVALRQVSAILASIAVDADVPEPALLGRHLAEMTIVFTHGVVCELARDTAAFRSAFDGLCRMIWNGIVAAVPDSVTQQRPRPFRSAG